MAQVQGDSDSLRRFGPVLVLLAICLFINYIDPGNLSIAAPSFMATPSLTELATAAEIAGSRL
jgi:hypothetical protein